MRGSGSPSSLNVIESSCTRSWNLCVSQQTMTGTLCALAIMAIRAVPETASTAPLERTDSAPTNTCRRKEQRARQVRVTQGADECTAEAQDIYKPPPKGNG